MAFRAKHDIRRFSDPRQAGPVVDGPTLERSSGKSATKCTLDSCESVRNGSRGENGRRAPTRQVDRYGVLPETWGTVMGLHEEVPRSRRNAADTKKRQNF